jgi:hypothetical protein
MQTALLEQPKCSRQSPYPLVQSLIDLLGQLHETLLPLTNEQYGRRPVGPIGSSIGAHVRHCLDHVAALVWAVESEDLTVDYDRRQRGTVIEANRQAALDAMTALTSRLKDLPLTPTAGIRIPALASPHNPPVMTMSTFVARSHLYSITRFTITRWLESSSN